MTTLKVPAMHCQVCVTRIKNALEEVNVTSQVDLATQTVTVEDSQVELVISELDDLGFEALPSA